jgi:hypothetical protein
MTYTFDEIRREQMEWDALQDRIADHKEQQQTKIKQLQEAIVEAMDDITANMNMVCTFNYYMDELSYYFNDRDYEMQEAFIKKYLIDLEEREQEDWEKDE